MLAAAGHELRLCGVGGTILDAVPSRSQVVVEPATVLVREAVGTAVGGVSSASRREVVVVGHLGSEAPVSVEKQANHLAGVS